MGATSAAVAMLCHSLVDFNLQVPANALLAAMVFGLMGAGRGTATCSAGRLGLRRGVSVLSIGALTLGLGWYVWSFGASDLAGLRATNAFYEGNARLAIRVARAGLEWRADDPALLAALGNASFGYEASLQFAESSNENGGFSDNTGISDAGRKKLFDTAGEAFADATRLQPQDRRYHIEYSRILVELDRRLEARSEAMLALRWDPWIGSTWSNLADLEIAFDRKHRALAILEIGQNLSGGEPLAWDAFDLREELSTDFDR